ncbi:MAG: 3-phosphoshikimate 1-carboxyvinyltransferase [Cyanobacteria bacterium P01_E01_bin.42]
MTRLLTPLSKVSSVPYTANIPGSKSFTNRALVIAAQRMGTTTIANALHAQDTDLLAQCLGQFSGLETEKTATGYRVTRTLERLKAPDQELYVGAAGTPTRFLLSFASMAEGETIVTGNPRLCERPMGDILDTFAKIGIQYECLKTEGCVPVKITGSAPTTREWPIDGGVSSQFVSSLLILATQQSEPITISVTKNLVSRPYVMMTVQMMRKCGIEVVENGLQSWTVTPGQAQVEEIPVETDASGMSYFLAAGALTQSKVIIPNIGNDSPQGDVGFARVLEQMGCLVTFNDDSIELEGRPLQGVDVDMEVMPDVVLTLATTAAYAKGSTRVTNIANLRVKECDRITAPVTELKRLGVGAEEGEDWLAVHPTGSVSPGRIHTYDDHRVAMSFALMGLLSSGIEIEDPECVGKSFPSFWQELERFYAHHEG